MNYRKKILVIFPDEISACIENSPWLTNDAEWICLTIDAYDRCLRLQLKNAYMPDWLVDQSTFSKVEYDRIFSSFEILERDFIRGRKSLGFSDDAYWNHQHNMTMMTVLSASLKNARLAAINLDKSSFYLIPQRMGVGDYHFSGGLIPSILRCILKNSGFKFDEIFIPQAVLSCPYDPAVYNKIPNYWSDDLSRSWRESRRNVIVSPCGVFNKHDQQKLLYILRKLNVNSNSWMLSPAFWSVIDDGPGFHHRVTIEMAFSALPAPMQNAVKDLVEEMTVATDKMFCELLDQHVLSLDFYDYQLQRIGQRHLFQCMNYLGLSHLSNIKPIEAVVVSNLDGGMNGPLFSVALDNSVPCYMVPHSHVHNQQTEGPCTVVTEFWQPKPSITFAGKLNQEIYTLSEIDSNIVNPPLPVFGDDAFDGLNKRSRVLILFNGIHRWTDINISINFLKGIIFDVQELCGSTNSDLTYRLKPGDQTPLDAYCRLLDIDRVLAQRGLEEKLSDILTKSDLVISFDEPSSALWDAIELGCAVVLITNRELLYSAVIDEDILKSYDHIEGLCLVKNLLNDRSELEKMRYAQFSKLNALRERRFPVNIFTD